jgi:hypothetical protein
MKELKRRHTVSLDTFLNRKSNKVKSLVLNAKIIAFIQRELVQATNNNPLRLIYFSEPQLAAI